MKIKTKFIFEFPDWSKDIHSHRNAITSTGKFKPFHRYERNRGVDYKPFKFPSLSTASENSRRVQWPSERHSFHANADVKTVVNPMAIIVFPRSESNDDDNESPLIESDEMAATATKPPSAFQSNELNGTNKPTISPLMPNSVNISAFIVNQTAIENKLKPAIYIDDDGIFQVEYIPKGETESHSTNTDQHPKFASINKTEEVAIIPNDNQQMPLNQHIQNETNTMSSPSSSSTTTTRTSKTPTTTEVTTIGLIHDQAINNTEAIFESHDIHTESTSSKPDQQTPQQLQPVPDKKHPKLFNELPIFA